MNDERARILRMVADGIVSPAEGEDLLAAVDTARPAVSTASPPASVSLTAQARPGPPRTLLFHVTEAGKAKVNLRIPLTLARAAGKFVPRQAERYLADYDISLDAFLRDLGATEGSGTLIEVVDGDNHVRIAVE